jgi:hypothetical protein
MGRRPLIAVTILAALGLVAGGCGGSSSNESKKTAAQIVQDATGAVKDVKGVHMTGTFVTSGKRVALTLDLGQQSGEGTLDLGDAHADVARVGRVSYIRANSAFWKLFAGQGAAVLLHDRWLSGATSKPPLNAFARFLSIDALVKEAFTGTASDKLKKLGTRTYKGQEVIAISDPADHETLLVAATGKPYPVAATGQGTIAFSDWDKDVSVTAPKGATDITGLGG